MQCTVYWSPLKIDMETSSVMGARWSMHFTQILQALGWLLIGFLAQFKVLAIAYKALLGLGPSYL